MARSICQLTFVGLGVLPLALCITWSLWQFSPLHQHRQARVWGELLSSQLGLRVSVAAFETRSPERFALHEIRLTHPETKAELGRIRLVEVQRLSGKWWIRLGQTELEGRHTATTWNLIHNAWLCRPQPTLQSVEISAAGCTIHGPTGDQLLQEITIVSPPTVDSTTVEIAFGMAANASTTTSQKSAALAHAASNPTDKHQIKLDLTRFHQQDELRTVLHLRTGATGLPCSLLAGLSPAIESLGAEASFSGSLDLTMRGSSWRGVLSNSVLAGIDLNQLTGGAGLALSGQAVLEVEQLEINDQRIELARGRGAITSGQISGELFHGLHQHLGVGVREINPLKAYGFDRFDFAVHIQQPNLLLGVVMHDAQGKLAERNDVASPIPLDRLVTALSSSTNIADGKGATPTASTLPSSWLAKQALRWLPLADEQSQQARANLQLSQTH